ncbi:MAG: MFS transporter [Saprospiraceae bacterium]|nr:MFS transporter [Saprospiraceae bacterium]MDP4698407.1 MFS transporter [Saprospiraceae bacterium]MDP4810326.1 MFS transporter [Saprospiraceae bacterium]MDP4815480.1 MFS transporter [Saprospiraceae bacterium]MDP4913183.1 MFS transporter [Saprospiraceae bacterium]
MRVLLLTNLIYGLVGPIIELFIGAYIMRNSSDISLVVIFQLAVYTGIPLTFMINGFLLNRIKIAWLYSFGMLLSGISMFAMMLLQQLDTMGVFLAGLIMGLSYGFFWANRDFLALNTTNDGTRNYYYGIETFFYTITGILVPLAAGAFIGATDKNGWFGGHVNTAYYILTAIVFVMSMFASILVHRGEFVNPKRAPFLFIKFDRIWNKMLGLASLKGLAQGYIVTAPTMLILSLVGKEGSLGLIQGIAAAVSAILLYVLGRVTGPKHRLLIYGIGCLLFMVGALLNASLYSALGVILFMMCLLFARPLLDIAYFPIQLKVIDYVAEKEKRNEFSYIFNHELGLYLGRLFGCGLFIVLARYVSEYAALRYALLVIAVLHALGWFMAKSILKEKELA